MRNGTSTGSAHFTNNTEDYINVLASPMLKPMRTHNIERIENLLGHSATFGRYSSKTSVVLALRGFFFVCMFGVFHPIENFLVIWRHLHCG